MAEATKSPLQASPGLVSPQMVKVYVVALVLVILAELIGFVRWTPIDKLTILLVPFVHTIWLAVLFAPQAAGRWVKVYNLSDSAWAAGIILTATYPLMVRYGTLVGPNVPQLLKAGFALILQEAGNNWGAIVMAMPIGILMGLRREVIGACYSVAREPNLSLIADIYGLDTPEGRGVIGTYITGTVLGTAFFSIIGSVFALTAPAIRRMNASLPSLRTSVSGSSPSGRNMNDSWCPEVTTGNATLSAFHAASRPAESPSKQQMTSGA